MINFLVSFKGEHSVTFWRRIARGANSILERSLAIRVQKVPRYTDQEDTHAYLARGQVPFGPGYVAYKTNLIAQILDSVDLLRRFRESDRLPPGFGYAVDERCIEYPWVIARLGDAPSTLLDAGSTLNYSFLLKRSIFDNKKLSILTLAPEANCFHTKGISYIYDDLREMPFADEKFDSIICISTLEHIGFDNRMFTDNHSISSEIEPRSFRQAVCEMRRVLRSGGFLYITMPYGIHTVLPTQQQFDARLVAEVKQAFAGNIVEEAYYRYSPAGWQISTAEECKDAEYVPWIALPPGARPSAFPLSLDRAAAARAVALLQLQKPG